MDPKTILAPFSFRVPHVIDSLKVTLSVSSPSTKELLTKPSLFTVVIALLAFKIWGKSFILKEFK